ISRRYVMHHTSFPRSAWVKFLLLLVVACDGLAGGLFLAGVFHRNTVSGPKAAMPVRFPLSAADVKSQIDAPEVSTGPDGRIYLIYPSQAKDGEHTLFLACSDDGGSSFDAPRAIAHSSIFKAVSKMKGKTITRDVKMMPHVAVR